MCIIFCNSIWLLVSREIYFKMHVDVDVFHRVVDCVIEKGIDSLNSCRVLNLNLKVNKLELFTVVIIINSHSY